jgi:hypothetical protein
MMRRLILLTFMLLLAGCQRPAGEFYELNGRIFVFNYRLAYATYLITLQRMKPVPEGMRFVARFENPAGGENLVVERAIFPAQGKLSIESPHIECVRKDRPYAVKIEIFDAANKLVQTVQTQVVSNLDQSILPKEPLVSGPAYDRNAKAVDSSGKITMRDTTACPA